VKRGFTLIETAVVLFIVALAAAIAAPAITRGVDSLRARAEIGGIATFLRHAREQAITRRETHEVRVDPEALTLVLIAAGSERPRASRRLSVPARIHADPPSALTVRFTPEGVSSGARFTVELPGQSPYVVTVEALTGRVTNRRAG
jgi:prepilin-type N-terminal cleavage/methylation domain-containing protein